VRIRQKFKINSEYRGRIVEIHFPLQIIRKMYSAYDIRLQVSDVVIL